MPDLVFRKLREMKLRELGMCAEVSSPKFLDKFLQPLGLVWDENPAEYFGTSVVELCGRLVLAIEYTSRGEDWLVFKGLEGES